MTPVNVKIRTAMVAAAVVAGGAVLWSGGPLAVSPAAAQEGYGGEGEGGRSSSSSDVDTGGGGQNHWLRPRPLDAAPPEEEVIVILPPQQVAPPPRTRTRRVERRRSRPVARRSPPASTTPSAPVLPPLPSERPNELIAFGLDDGALSTLAGQGYTVIERTSIGLLGGDVVRLEVPAGTALASARTAVLAAAPDAVVDVNAIYTPTEGPGCEGLACTQLALVGWPRTVTAPAATPATCGEGVTLGIIDTGINPDHDALKAADVTLIPLVGDAPATSRQTHGTAVAAVLVGSGDDRIQGLLPKAKLLAIDAFAEEDGGRTHSDAYSLVRALDIMAQRHPDVLNLSLTGPANLLLERAIDAVEDENIVIVAAVGNAGPAADPLYPAAYPNVIAVTAVDKDRRIYRRAVQGDHVDFAAPGVDVWTAASLRGARPKTGTSFAAPFVTAAVALARSGGAADQPAIVERLRGHVDDLGETGRDRVFGWGLINAADLCTAPAATEAPVVAASAPAEGVEDASYTAASE
ncbi:S8 family serine peptidase [Acuticoccus mangrovi]|uniref:S8 family serine peptidase n=1 Tax=Acuticoccus mangrovi TaxID=2796142 RepID=A0A934MGB0_9HYPH|nr:S8 family serine peptidase [Acuticoccus mangrovi]MBJ3774776.1 S8 family serine peptidase [Acuticoccus mangrovi]